MSKKPVKLHMLSTAQLAERLGVTQVTLRSWRMREQGPPYIRISPRRVRYRVEDVERWEENCRRAPA